MGVQVRQRTIILQTIRKMIQKISGILISLALFTLGCSNQREEPILLKSDPSFNVGPSNIIGVNHIGLSVNDLGKAVNFYKQSAGLSLVSDRQAIDHPFSVISKEELSGQMQILQGPNTSIRIMEFDQKDSGRFSEMLEVQGPGVTHICYIGPKAQPIDGRFVKNGATWESSSNAMVNMRGVGYMYGYLRDPDGLMLEIEHAPEPNFRGQLWFGHVATAVMDLTKTMEFYERMLGFPHYRRADNREGPTYDQVAGVENVKIHGAWFRVAPFYSLEFWQFLNPKPEPPSRIKSPNEIGYNLIALETTDVDAEFNRLNSLGIPFETEILDVLDGRAFYFRDLDGNLLAFMEFNPGSNLSLKATISNK